MAQRGSMVGPLLGILTLRTSSRDSRASFPFHSLMLTLLLIQCLSLSRRATQQLTSSTTRQSSRRLSSNKKMTTPKRSPPAGRPLRPLSLSQDRARRKTRNRSETSERRSEPFGPTSVACDKVESFRRQRTGSKGAVKDLKKE
jgi:ABC-type anion transport system duplicated permease subunit